MQKKTNYPNYLNQDDENINLSSIFNIIIGKWYWFILSVFMMLSLGVIYIYITPKVYKRSATILIKDSKNGIGIANQAMAFADIAGLSGLAQSNTENEMLILKSRFLIERVILELGSHISYFQREFMRNIELYENSPIRIRESEIGVLMPGKFKLKVLDENKFLLITQENSFYGNFNKEELYPFGLITIECYPQLINQFINQEIQIEISNRRQIIDNYLSSLSANLINKNASIVQLNLTSSCPGKADDILNTLLEIYNKDAIDDKNIVLDNSQLFIDERLSVIRKDLNEVDSRIEGYKRSTLSTNVGVESSLYLQNASKLEENISSIEIQSSIIDILVEFLSRPNIKRELLPFNIGLDNANLNNQIQIYNENLIKMNRLISASSERNPVVEDMSVALDAARTSIEKTVRDMQKSIMIQQQELANRTQRTTGRIEAVSTNERNVRSIERDQKIKAELYLYLLNKSEENAIMRSMTEANARIIDKAYGIDSPIEPRKSFILFGCLIIGLFVPGIFFVIRDLFYTKVRGRSDVTAIIKAPLLGEIPMKPKSKISEQMMVRDGSSEHICEAFRIIRTNLSFMDPNNTMKILASTSTLPGEGKTYITLNLAMTLALSGKKVCLVDLDLRRASLSRCLQKKSDLGVSDFLANINSNLEALIKQTQYSNHLYILPAGSIPPNPAELLLGNRYDYMMNILRDQFDYIVVDNPPFQIVADGGIANRCVDLTFYVIRAGLLDRRELENIQLIYNEQKLKNMALIITDVDYERLYYSIGYKGYGKHYGYDNYNSYAKDYYDNRS